jgi:hypothetical protein
VSIPNPNKIGDTENKTETETENKTETIAPQETFCIAVI